MVDVEGLSRGLNSALLTTDWSAWVAGVAAQFSAGRVHLTPLVEVGPCAAVALFGWKAEEIEYYGANFRQLDMYIQRFRPIAPMTPIGFADVLKAEEQTSSEIANSFWKPLRIGQMLSIQLLVDGFPYIFSCVRDIDSPPFLADEYNAMARLAPGMTQSLTFANRLSSANTARKVYQSALDEIGLATFVLGPRRTVVHTNVPALGLVQHDRLLSIRSGSRLVANGERNDDSVQRAFDQVATGGQNRSATVIRQRDTRVPYTLVMVKAQSSPLQVVMFVLRHESEKIEVSQQHLRRVFDLTGKEANVASLLAAGADISDIAKQMQVGREAVRYHLKQLFAKTQTSGQVQLVKLLTTSVGPLTNIPTQ